MAYDEQVAERLRRALAATRGTTERRMFGGLTFLVNGNVCCGVAGDELMVRVGDERGDALARKPHARPCDFTGRPMRGLVLVSPGGFRTQAALARWVAEAVDHASSLPRKAPKPKRDVGSAHGRARGGRTPTAPKRSRRTR